MSHPSRTLAVASLAVAAALYGQAAWAQSATAVRATVQRALQNNPDVGSRLHAYLAQSKAVDVASAGWKPKLDLSGDAGVNRSKDAADVSTTIKRTGVGLTVSQLLWDGMGTRNEVNRAGHERLARWFEFVDATEQTALDATKALYDVQRQRRLVQIAEASLNNHRNAVNKLESRVKAGVGRGVDLDQARARLALAESNLETELSNLHDVGSRFQRVVGETPSADAGTLELLQAGMPGAPLEALQAALARSPAIAAGIEGVRAARAGEAASRSALQPRLEARANAGGGKNYGGVDGRRTDAGVALVLNWNLYNGGADSARIGQQQALLSQAMAQRDKACGEVRQSVTTAYNDVAKLTAQIATLERNATAIERARDAYLQQFEIGQRSLLDLLNAENETFSARRALVNAEYDRALAHARVHAAMSQLNTQLGLSREGNTDVAKGWQAGDDAAGRCPAQLIDTQSLRGASALAPLGAAPAAAAAAVPLAPAVLATALPLREVASAQARPLAAAAPSDEDLTRTLSARVESWARAQRSKDMNRFAALYAPDFAGDEGSSQIWRAKQLRQFSQRGVLAVKVSALSTTELPDGQVETRFRHTVSSASYREAGDKVLVWANQGGQWRIVKEVNL